MKQMGCKKPLKQLISLIGRFMRSMFERYKEHKISQAGAQVAYFFLLSFFPFVIFFNAFVGIFDLSITKVMGSLSALLPPQILSPFQAYVEFMSNNSSAKLVSAGIVVTLFSSSKLVRVLGQSINHAYDIDEKRHFFTRTLFSMALTVAITVIIVLTVFLIAIGNDLATKAMTHFKISADTLNLIYISGWGTLIIILFSGLSLMYYAMPNKKVTFRSIIPGTLFCMAGFLLSILCFSVYADYMMSYSAYYGSMGAVLLILLWLYFSGIVLVLGAELNSFLEEFSMNQFKED